jgi:hypothetical protein
LIALSSENGGRKRNRTEANSTSFFNNKGQKENMLKVKQRRF